MAGTRFWHGINGRARAYMPASTANSPYAVAQAIRSEFMIREMVIPIKYTDGTAEFPTNFQFPANAIELNTRLYVRTAEAGGTTKQVSVGTATADGGTPTAFLNLADVSVTGIRWLSNTQPLAITVGASPYTYTSVGANLISVTGGTVSSIAIKRGGTTTTVASATGGTYALVDGDQLIVTYSGLPTMIDLQTEGDTVTNVGGKRVSWTPASNNFTTLDADVIIEYLAFGDLTQFQTSGEAPEQGTD